MNRKIIDIIKSTEVEKAPPSLLESIFCAIEKEKVNLARRYFIFSFLVAIFSSYGAYISLASFNESASFSGLYDVLFLLFRDTAIIFSSFGDYLFSIVESLPIIEISFFILFFLPMFISFRYISKNIKFVFKKA